MNKNIKRFILFLSIIIVIVLGILMLLRFLEYSRKENEKRQWESIEAEEVETTIAKKLRSETNMRVDTIFTDLILDEKYFIIYDDYLTEHFKEKYKSKYDLMPECDTLKMHSSGSSNIYGNKGLWNLDVSWHDETKPYITTYYYRFDVTPDRQLNDFELVKKVDRDSYTHARLDGIKEITNEDIRHYLAIYTTPTYFCYKGYEVENYQNTPEYMKYHDIQLAPNCEVINKPERVYYGYLSGNDIYTFHCPDDVKKYYKIDFKLNDNLEFERIEYIDVTNE